MQDDRNLVTNTADKDVVHVMGQKMNATKEHGVTLILRDVRQARVDIEYVIFTFEHFFKLTIWKNKTDTISFLVHVQSLYIEFITIYSLMYEYYYITIIRRWNTRIHVWRHSR